MVKWTGSCGDLVSYLWSSHASDIWNWCSDDHPDTWVEASVPEMGSLAWPSASISVWQHVKIVRADTPLRYTLYVARTLDSHETNRKQMHLINSVSSRRAQDACIASFWACDRISLIQSKIHFCAKVYNSLAVQNKLFFPFFVCVLFCFWGKGGWGGGGGAFLVSVTRQHS